MRLLVVAPSLDGHVVASRTATADEIAAAVANPAWKELALVTTEIDAYDGDPVPVAGLTRVDRAAPVLPATDLASYARQRSYDIEVSGIELAGLPISTARESQGLISRAVALLDADPTLSSVDYDTGGLPVTLPAAQVRAVGIAVGRHVQGTFAKRAAALRAIAGGSATTRADVDAIFSEG